jgi:hypothetical protein
MNAMAPITSATVTLLARAVLDLRATVTAPEAGCERCVAFARKGHRSCGGHSRAVAGCEGCGEHGRLGCPDHGEIAASRGIVVRFARTERLASLEKTVAKLAKRAKVLDMTPPSIIAGEPVAVSYRDENGVERWQERVPVVAVGESPRINGWSFVARIDHAPELNTVAKAGDRDLPARFWTATAVCDHCALDRRRKTTYVLTDGDKLVQVGASCLADFLGHPNPDHFAAVAEWESALAAMGDDDGFEGGGAAAFPAVRFLAYVADVIATCGWMSAAKADQCNAVPTSQVAFVRMYKERAFVTLDKATATARAEAVIAWCTGLYDGTPDGLAGLSDYQRNLVAAALSGMWKRGNGGILASAFAAKQRADGIEYAKRAPKLPSAHFGTVGKREVFTFTVSKVFSSESQWGASHMHLLTDAQGNVAKWRSSTVCLTVGDIVTGKATVKAHGDYNGTPQTEVSRCAFEVTGKAPDAAPMYGAETVNVPRGFESGED